MFELSGNHEDVAASLAGHSPGSRVTREVYNQSNTSRKRKAVQESIEPCLRTCGKLLQDLAVGASDKPSAKRLKA